MDTQGFDPWPSRMLSGRDTTTPCAQICGVASFNDAWVRKVILSRTCSLVLDPPSCDCVPRNRTDVGQAVVWTRFFRAGCAYETGQVWPGEVAPLRIRVITRNGAA